MNDHTALFLSKLQSMRRGIQEGWYAVDKDGNLCFGPFVTREACVNNTTPPAQVIERE
jgi:hypothetical protein